MVEFFLILISIVIFLSICYFLRVKGIDFPGSDPLESGVLLSLLFIACLIWPVSLPIAAISCAGLFIIGKFDD